MAAQPTAEDVASWMYKQVREEGRIAYHRTALTIKERFGEQFTRPLESGYLGIATGVNDAFRELSEKDVVWERTDSLWRLRRDTDPPGRQV